MTITTRGLAHPRLLTGTIESVDPVRYTAAVRPSYDGGSLIHDVVLSASYVNPLTGSGTYTVPEVGTQVVYLDPSEPFTRPIILCSYATPRGDGTGSRDANRRASTPGDNRIDVVGGAHLHVLRRGAVELGVSPACRIVLSANPDTIDLLTGDTLRITSPGVSLHTEVLPDGYDADGRIATRTTWDAWMYVSDTTPVFRAEFGVLDDADIASRLTHYDAQGTTLLSIASYLDGQVRLATSSQIDIVAQEETEVPANVLISGDLLTDIANALQELSTALAALGASTPQTVSVIGKLQAAVADPTTTRYSSKVLRTR